MPWCVHPDSINLIVYETFLSAPMYCYTSLEIVAYYLRTVSDLVKQDIGNPKVSVRRKQIKPEGFRA
ncbi:MAG: hypothetical protein HYT71_04205 [Candidatus Aenigmarchaeota archaeon]|nr:hypothetical protein [Candidatus Aenigmarchaeota archaeon]